MSLTFPNKFGGGGATTFTGLTDTPSTLSGQGSKEVRVNSGGTALEFVPPGTASVAIGSAVASGTVSSVLLIDASGNLTQSSAANTTPLIITRAAGTGTVPPLVTFTGAAHTALTASTEHTMINVVPGTVTFATGALTTNRTVRFQAPTLAFDGASTVTTASTLEISGAPIAGTNATITAPLALNVASGNTQFKGNVIIGNTATSSIPLLAYASSDAATIVAQSQNGNTGTSATSQFNVRCGTAVGKIIQYGATHSSTPALLQWESPGNIYINAIGGGVGINQTTPTARLHVEEATATRTGMILKSTDSSTSNKLLTLQNSTSDLLTVGAAGRVSILGAITGSAALDIYQGGPEFTMLLGSDSLATTRTNNTNKQAKIACIHYASANTPICLVHALATNGVNTLRLGGGTSTLNSATLVELYTGANSTTLSGTVRVQVNSAGNFLIGGTADNARLSVTRDAATGTVLPLVLFTSAADTALTASTESTSINFNLSATRQFATGALATQRAFRVQAPTYSAVGASTITTAVTLAIDNAPQAGANVTITNPYAIRVAAGAVKFGGKLGVNGVEPATQATKITDASDLGSAITAINAIIDCLEAHGFAAV